MKIYIASDFHGNFEAARRVVDAFIAGGGDKLVILGDIYYHGARNPLPENYSPVRLANLLNSIKDKVVAIKGNCDSEVDETVRSSSSISPTPWPTSEKLICLLTAIK